MRQIRILIYCLVVCCPLFGFGQNKVQYINFSWQSLKAPHYTLYYHQNTGNLPALSYVLTSDIYRTLQRRFQFTHREPVPLITYGDPNLFAQTNVISENLPEGVGGFTEFFKTRVVIPFTGSYEEYAHVLHHEMVHAFMYGIFADQMGGSFLMGGGLQLPLWFNEGLAEYLSSGWNIEADMFLMDYTINADVPLPGPQLDGYMAYKGGQSFLQYLVSTRGDSLFSVLLHELKTAKSLDKTIKAVYRKDLEELGREWVKELRRIYWPEIGRRRDQEKSATRVTDHRKSRDFVNLRPRISPDGKKIAFFSDRNDYTSILITDRKGKVLHTISQSGYGGFFESFHPFRSGMCWSPDGSRLAFVTKSGGHDQIRIVDIAEKKLVKTIDPPGLASIAGPDWSHDGTKLVFACVNHGESNLYLYRLDSARLQKLTGGPAFKSDPHFMPGDSAIIYALQDTCLKIGDPPQTIWGAASSDLAVISLDGNAGRVLARTPWNEKQACASQKNGEVLFVSDRNGIDNLYIGSIDSIGKARPVTDCIGGCSNPDWSADGRDAVFTLFSNQGWDVWLMENPPSRIVGDSLVNTNWVAARLDSTKMFFDSVPRAADTVAADSTDRVFSRSDALRSTVDSATAADLASPDSLRRALVPQPQPYTLKFSPDLVTLGLGVSSYYGYAGGQWLLSFSDIMGDHRITLAGDLQYDFESTMHVFGSYMYLKNRIDIGGGAYYYKDYSLMGVTSDSLYFYDKETAAFVQASYPFSMFSRLDLQVFGRTINRTPRSLYTGYTPGEGTAQVNTLMPSLAYSYDNILWGMTGPLNGTRAAAALDLLPPVRFIDEPFLSLEADVRHYAHLWKRFVWANRIFIGASEPIGDNLSPRRYFLGGSENWLYTYSSKDINFREYRNFARNSFYSDIVVPFRGWRYFDLSGSRVAVLNTEFRFPFIKEFSLAWPLPFAIRYVNGAVFADVGNAWDPAEQTKTLPLPRTVNGGIGFGGRLNLGMFVLRYDRGWPANVTTASWSGGPINYFSMGAEF